MARIRSIKPEFWRDEKIANLKNKLSALFFIGLWNVADDEGKFPWNPKQLSLELPIFRTKEVVIYLSGLSQVGLIQKSACSQWGLITKWKHQRIDKPKVPDVKKESIQWLTTTDSKNNPGSFANDPRKDRIGKDRIGKDSLRENSKNSTPKNSDLFDENKPEEPPPAGDSQQVVQENSSVLIGEFHLLWKQQHGGRAPLMPKDYKLLKTVYEELGKDRSIQLVRAFFKMPDAWFIGRRHDVVTFNSNLSKIAHFADTGTFVSQSQILAADKMAGNMALIKHYEDKKDEK